MCRLSASDQFTALASGELGRWRTARLQRHIAQCSTCRTEWEATRDLWSLAQTLQSDVVPDSLRARIAERLTALISPELPSTSERTPNRAGAWRWGAALAGAGLTLAVAVTMLLPGRSNFAFADVAQAMQKVGAIRFSLSAFNVETDGRQEPMGKTTFWVRPHPLTIAHREGQRRFVEDGLRAWSIDTKTGAVTTEPNPMRTEGLDMILAPRTPLSAMVQRNTGATSEFPSHPWTVRRVTLEGREVVQFRRTSEAATDDKTITREEMEQTVWVDPKTRLVVRSEGTETFRQADGQPAAIGRVVLDGFHYNEAPPAGAFDLPSTNTKRKK